MRTRTTGIIALVVFAALSSAAAAADIWYEDNNLGKAGSMPSDFVEKFQHPESFKQASRYIRVYMVRSNILGKLTDDFLAKQFDPYLKQNNIKLAIDAGGATWSQERGRGKVADREIEMLERLKRLGVQVDYISLQSVLSKPLKVDGRKTDYPLQKRVDDIVAYCKAVREIYPQAKIGLIDALPSHSKEYRKPYRAVKDALARESISLSYIHLDMPFEIAREQRRGITWKTIREVERYVENDLGLKFGLLATSRDGGQASNKAFHERVMAALQCYAGSDGTPGDYIIASWFTYPEKTIPETSTGDDYPAMRTVLEFGRQLEAIEQAGPSWAGQQENQPGWRSLCVY